MLLLSMYSILLNKLNQSINPTAATLQHWTEPYSDRTVYFIPWGRTNAVKIRQRTSARRTTQHRVPQGSVLGPMLFNQYCLSYVRW